MCLAPSRNRREFFGKRGVEIRPSASFGSEKLSGTPPVRQVGNAVNNKEHAAPYLFWKFPRTPGVMLFGDNTPSAYRRLKKIE